MNVGTKSILFGVHQFLWHPFVVARAWRALYGKWPDRYAWVAIFTHDLGYWGLENMDGDEGQHHPERSQKIAFFIAKWVSRLYWWNAFKRCPVGCDVAQALTAAIMVRHHSREMVKRDNEKDFGYPINFSPSALCWPDKFSVVFEPDWFYLLRAEMSGEIREFKQNAIRAGKIPATATDREWLHWYRSSVVSIPRVRELVYRELYVPKGQTARLYSAR